MTSKKLKQIRLKSHIFRSDKVHVQRIMDVLTKRGYRLTWHDAQELWKRYSESFAEGLAYPSENDGVLYDSLRSYWEEGQAAIPSEGTLIGDIELRREGTTNKILHFVYDRTFDMNSTFIRLAEYVESAIDALRGNHFTIERAASEYAKRFGNFTYYTDWSGHNIQSDPLRMFFETFRDLRPQERLLRDMLESMVGPRFIGNYTVIATSKEDPLWESTVNHELAHCLYSLDNNYMKDVDELILSLPDSIQNFYVGNLMSMGYHDEVIMDEMQAYLATSPTYWLKEKMDSISDRCLKIIPKFQKLFRTYLAHYEIQYRRMPSENTIESRRRKMNLFTQYIHNPQA